MPWQIVNVPGKPPSSPELSTVDVLASSIEPKLANTLVRRLNQLCPLENLCHVKRVRKRSVEGKVELSVILCLCQEPGSHGVGMPNDLFQLASTYKLSPYKAKVARSAALSKEEWEEQCKLWPTSYHPSFNPLDSGFDEEESQKIINYMQLAHKLLRTPDNKVVNAAVIVDPLNGKIIASANDQTLSGFPRNETISNCISCSELSIAAFSQPGENSLRNLDCGSESKLLTHDLSSVSCLYPWRWTDHRHDNHSSQANCEGNISWHPLRHAVLVAIEKAAARDRQLFPCLKFQNDQPLPNMGLHDFSDNTPSKRQKTIISDNLSLEANDVHPECMPPEALRPYLCTGFDIYIGWEPCAMCAMALVHQRIRRIFYAFPNPNAGALGSVYRLQGERSLNHHYSVFRILIPEEDN